MDSTSTQQPQAHHPDRAGALQQIPPHLHGRADAMAAAGLPWPQIIAIIQAILAGVGPLLGGAGKPAATAP